MAKLANTRIFGSLTANTVVANIGTGFQNVVVLTSGSSATYTFPTSLQVPGAKFKLTLIGGGGGGGGAANVAGAGATVGGGGGASGLVMVYQTVVSGQYSLTYTVGAGGAGGNSSVTAPNGTSTTVTYNSVTYTAGYGQGGIPGQSSTYNSASGGTATGGTINIVGGFGSTAGQQNTAVAISGVGGDTPLGYGKGGLQPISSTGNTGLDGTGYGSGGSGGRLGTGTLKQVGGAGAPGVLIIEY